MLLEFEIRTNEYPQPIKVSKMLYSRPNGLDFLGKVTILHLLIFINIFNPLPYSNEILIHREGMPIIRNKEHLTM